jgi:hypothetical protein
MDSNGCLANLAREGNNRAYIDPARVTHHLMFKIDLFDEQANLVTHSAVLTPTVISHEHAWWSQKTIIARIAITNNWMRIYSFDVTP